MNDNEASEVNAEDLEKSFNDSLEGLRKSLGVGELESEDLKGTLSKAKSDSKKAMDYDEGAEESEEEEDEDEDKDIKKSMPSIEDQLADDPESEAAMDVAPFLRQLTKAIDERFVALEKSLTNSDTLMKSIGNAQLSQMSLVKSQSDTVNRIAAQDVKTAGVTRLGKSRFDDSGKDVEISGPEVLSKSQDWLKSGKVSLVEAGQIESRVNKGNLGRIGDSVDKKVLHLIKEAK